FHNFQFGYASAQSLVLFAIILVLTVIQFAFVEKRVHYQ
ncbi:MAG: sugar ABC transporter permease, partial [Chloroflexi bacterium]|nr:sugar ABC transporter permease [Chloroflexota bacterium]